MLKNGGHDDAAADVEQLAHHSTGDHTVQPEVEDDEEGPEEQPQDLIGNETAVAQQSPPTGYEDDIPRDAIQEILSHHTLAWLHFRQQTGAEFFLQYNHRCTLLSVSLVSEALHVFPEPLLCFLAKFIPRVGFEWEHPWTQGLSEYQVITDLRFEGPGADLPFPALDITVDPNGTITPNIPGPLTDQAGHVHIASHPSWQQQTVCDSSRITIIFRHSFLSSLYITLQRETPHLPGRILVEMSPTPLEEAPLALEPYRAFCGVLLKIFLHPDMSPLPRVLRESMLTMRLDSLPDPPFIGPKQLLNLPDNIRDALALVNMRLRQVVPASVLEAGNPRQECELARILY